MPHTKISHNYLNDLAIFSGYSDVVTVGVTGYDQHIMDRET